MKMFMFRHQLNLPKGTATNLKNICFFICLIYIKHWMQCCVASNAPHNDLDFIKQLDRYSAVNKQISNLAMNKFTDHLWYLGSELVVLSLFSDKVSDSIKQRMFTKMKRLDDGQWNERNWCLLDADGIMRKELDDLVDASSMSVLKSMQIDIQFMFDNHTNTWNQLESYQKSKKIVDSFHVVNDCAERTLKLMTDFNESLTSDEAEMQRVIQVVEGNRDKIPKGKKSVLASFNQYSS